MLSEFLNTKQPWLSVNYQIQPVSHLMASSSIQNHTGYLLNHLLHIIEKSEYATFNTFLKTTAKDGDYYIFQGNVFNGKYNYGRPNNLEYPIQIFNIYERILVLTDAYNLYCLSNMKFYLVKFDFSSVLDYPNYLTSEAIMSSFDNKITTNVPSLAADYAVLSQDFTGKIIFVANQKTHGFTSYDQAKIYCQKYGGDLYVPKNEYELEILIRLLQKSNDKFHATGYYTVMSIICACKLATCRGSYLALLEL